MGCSMDRPVVDWDGMDGHSNEASVVYGLENIRDDFGNGLDNHEMVLHGFHGAEISLPLLAVVDMTISPASFVRRLCCP